jgi:hypothetical protein
MFLTVFEPAIFIRPIHRASCWADARRATRVNPVQALRYD